MTTPNPDTTQVQTYKLSEVAKMFGVSYQALWVKVKKGTFPARPIDIGGGYRFLRRDIHKLLGLPEDE